MFHLLIDVGEGVVASLEKGMADIASSWSIGKLSSIPNAILITHSHDDHIKELPILLNKLSGSDKLNIYCTKECHDQIMDKFPQIVGSRRKVIGISSVCNLHSLSSCYADAMNCSGPP